MKKKVFEKSKLFCFLIAIVLAFCTGIILVTNASEQSQNAFADEVAVFEEGGSDFDQNLWKALKVYYSANKATIDENVTTELKTDMFASESFSGKTLDLAGKSIESIKNLKLFDLSKFAGIDLSNNKLTTIGDDLLGGAFEGVDLSNNAIESFNGSQLVCTNLKTLNLSNNSITNCDLSGVVSSTGVSVNISFNQIESFVVPSNVTTTVRATHNQIDVDSLENFEKSTNTNIDFGFQGVTKKQYNMQNAPKIQFFGIDGVGSVKVWKGDTKDYDPKNDFQRLINGTYLPSAYNVCCANLSKDQTFQISEYGYYKITFFDDDEQKTSTQVQDIAFDVVPKKPTVKMFQKGQELKKFQGYVNIPTQVKIDSTDGVTTIFRSYPKGTTFETGDTIDISNEGWQQYQIFQICNGCLSEPLVITINYQKGATGGWIFALVVIAAFCVLFYVAYKNIPRIATFGQKNKKGKNLD